MDKIKRNEFLKELGFKGSALFALYCTGVSCLPADVNPVETTTGKTLLKLDLSDTANGDLVKNGGYIVRNSIIVANNNGSYIAATQICSHENLRAITFRNTEWYCIEHGARFSLSGQGLNKNGSKGIKVYAVTKVGNELTVSQ
jgi:nitrite reductase/ring-hydroxylating ferredoxin subunit